MSVQAVSAGDEIRPAELFSGHRIKTQQRRFAALAHKNQQKIIGKRCLENIRFGANRHRCGKLRIRRIGLISVDLVDNCCKDSDKSGHHDQRRSEQQAFQLCLDPQGGGVERRLIRTRVPKFRL